MGRRRRRARGSGGFLAVLGAVYLYATGTYLTLLLFGVAVVAIWVGFFKRTSCDVELRSGRGCDKNARGRLRACDIVSHQRAKHDALFAMVGLGNPARRWRVKWARSATPYGRTSPAPSEPLPRVMNPAYDAVMLAATVLGTAGTLVALFVQL